MNNKPDNTDAVEPDLAMQLTPEPGESNLDEERQEPQLETESVDSEVEVDDFDFEPVSEQEQEQWEQEMSVENAVEVEPVSVEPVTEFAPAVEEVVQPVPSVPLQDRLVPRISIDIFCNTSETGVVMQSVASDRRLNRAHVSVQMGGVTAATENYTGASTPDLLVVEFEGNRDQVLGDLAGLAQVCDSGTKVVVIGQVNDIMLYRELVRQGVSEYLVAPLGIGAVIDTISGLYSDPEQAPIGRSIVFTGAKGGVGSSCIAHNVAWCISERMKYDVTLIDLDLPFGTAGLDFNEDSSQGVADALMDPERLDDQLLDRLLVKCSEHLSLFTSPGSLERDYMMEPSSFDSILDTVRSSVPCMVVDLPHVWEPWSRHILSTADEIVITATPDLASLRNTKNLMDTLKQSRQNDVPPRLVINQVGIPKRPEIPAKDFAEAIGSEVELVLPFEPQLFGTATNNGQMIGEVKADAKSTLGMLELAKVLTNREVVEGKQSTMTKFWKQVVGK
jgi:pilus assembly protein CpaE